MSNAPLLYENPKWYPHNFPDIPIKVNGREESITRKAFGALALSNKNALKSYRTLFCGWTPQMFSTLSKEAISNIRTFLVHHGYKIPEDDIMIPIYTKLTRAVWSIFQTPPDCPKPDYSNE